MRMTQYFLLSRIKNDTIINRHPRNIILCSRTLHLLSISPPAKCVREKKTWNFPSLWLESDLLHKWHFLISFFCRHVEQLSTTPPISGGEVSISPESIKRYKKTRGGGVPYPVFGVKMKNVWLAATTFIQILFQQIHPHNQNQASQNWAARLMFSFKLWVNLGMLRDCWFVLGDAVVCSESGRGFCHNHGSAKNGWFYPPKTNEFVPLKSYYFSRKIPLPTIDFQGTC